MADPEYGIGNTTVAFLLPLNGTRIQAGINSSLDILLPLETAATESGPDRDLALLKTQLDQTRFVAQRILTPIIVLFGVVGNLMNIVVLTRRWMRSSTNYYLTALAVCDIMYLVFAFMQSLKHYNTVPNQDWYIRYRNLFGRPFVDIFSNTGVWLTLTFTIERYIGVCHPMKGKRWCTPQRAKYIIIVVALCATLITVPEFFQFTIIEERDAYNRTYLRPELSAFGQSHTYQFGYMYMLQALFTIIPLLLLLIFNSLLINAVLHAAKQRKAMSNLTVVRNERHERHNREQQKITVMLISVVIVFLVCQMPQAITNLYQSYLQATAEITMTQRYRLLINNNVCNTLVMINASINFVLYSSFSTKFRGTFKRIFCKCLERKDANHLFSEFVSMSGHGAHVAGDKKYSMSYSTGRTSISTSGSVGKPLLKNGNSMDTLLKRDYSAGNLLRPPITPRKKNGYLEVQQDNTDNIDSVVSSL